MIYLKSTEPDIKIIVLETENIESIKQGKPAKTADGSVLIAWTPDPVWLADKIMGTDGDSEAIGKLIDESAKRTQKPSGRKKHNSHIHKFGDDHV